MCREGFGFLSPSYRACEVRFGAFRKMKYIFSIASEKSFGEVATGSDNVRCWTHIRHVQHSKVQSVLRVGASDALALECLTLATVVGDVSSVRVSVLSSARQICSVSVGWSSEVSDTCSTVLITL